MQQTVAYTSETATTWKGSDTSDPGIGLMATYEFLYATGGGDACLSTVGSSYYSSCGTAANDWMKPSSHSWFLTPRISYTNYALYLLTDGYVYADTVEHGRQALPAVFLKPSVKIKSGNGTSVDSAYVLQ